MLIVDHINSGKRTKRLVPRRTLHDRAVLANDSVDGDEQNEVEG